MGLVGVHKKVLGNYFSFKSFYILYNGNNKNG